MTYEADFCGFPFQQAELLAPKAERRLTAPDGLPDLVIATSTPPFMNVVEDVLAEHAWFVQQTRVLCPKDTAFVYGLQCAPENSAAGGAVTSEDMRTLSQAGIRLMSLAYEMPTIYGGGFATPDEPLTARGRALLYWMAGAGMILDLSHTAHRTCRDALEFVSKNKLDLPVAASHVGCYAIQPHLRNLPDDILQQIARRGGVVGLLTVGWILGPKKEDDLPEPFLRHFKHLLSVVGEDAIAIGSDGIYRKLDNTEQRKRFQKMRTRLDPRGNFKPRATEEPEIFQGAHRLYVIRNLLAESCYSPRIVDKALGKNLAKFLINAAYKPQ